MFLPQSTHREVEGFGADLRDQLPRTVTSLHVFFFFSYNSLPLWTQGALRPRNWKCQCFPLVFLRPSREELDIEVKGAAGENDNWELLNRRRGRASCEHASKTHYLIEVQSWKGSCIKPSDIIPSFPRCRIQSQESGMVCSKLKLIRSNSVTTNVELICDGAMFPLSIVLFHSVVSLTQWL